MGLKYPVVLVHDKETGLIVGEVKDCNDAWTMANTKNETLTMLHSAFMELLPLNHFENSLHRPIQLPSPFEDDDYIELSDEISEKIMAFNSQFTPADWEYWSFMK